MVRALLLLGSAFIVDATVWTIDSTVDREGKCPSQSIYKCTYRAALDAINAYDKLEPITIHLPPERFQISYKTLPSLMVTQYKLPYKKIAFVGSVHNGTGARTTLDGLGMYQLLKTQVHVEVNVSDIDFVNGAATGIGEGNELNGGAVINDGTMRLHRCSFSDNWAAGAGGALQNTGDLELKHVSFTRNHARDAGALASTGTQTRRTSLRALDVNFTHNYANQSAGALLNDQGHCEIQTARFTNHAATNLNTVGGTLFNGNGGGATMHLTDAYVAHSYAGSGGIVSNGGTLVATRVTFRDGNATNAAGGAVENKGDAFFTDCSFNETRVQNREDPKRYVQGATLAMTETNATTTFLNCSIDGLRTKAQPHDGSFRPSELYVSAAGAVLNLTFTNVTNCHSGGGPNPTDPDGGDSGTLMLEAPGTPQHPDRKVIVRGSHVCEDGTYTKMAIRDEILQKYIAGCADAPWQCGDRALCTELKFGASVKLGSGLGVSCQCGAGGVGLPTMWGFPYGGGPTIKDSDGFAGCFEQWDAALGNLSATCTTVGSQAAPTRCAVTPAFAFVDGDATGGTDESHPPSRTSFSVCALRDAANPTAAVRATVAANPYARDHNSLSGTSAPAVTRASVSPHTASKLLTAAVTKSFDGNHSSKYSVNVSFVPGDALCTPGKPSICYNETGEERFCVSQTKYPVEQLHGRAPCHAVETAGDAATACGYALASDTCDCPVCKPLATYACDCNGTADGTAVCAADGDSLHCDCDTPYAFYPPSPPLSPPPPAASSSSPAGLIAAVVGALVVFGGAGGALMYRRSVLRREAALHEMQDGLLDCPGAAPPVNSAVNAAGATGSGAA